MQNQCLYSVTLLPTSVRFASGNIIGQVQHFRKGQVASVSSELIPFEKQNGSAAVPSEQHISILQTDESLI